MRKGNGVIDQFAGAINIIGEVLKSCHWHESGGVEERLELVDGVAELVCAATFADDFIDVAAIIICQALQYARVLQPFDPTPRNW